jgi:hypothetical protein
MAGGSSAPSSSSCLSTSSWSRSCWTRRVDVVGRVADAFERVFPLQLLEDLHELGLVPLGVLVRTVVGDCVGERVEVAPLEPPHGHLGHAEALGGLQARIAGDHLTAAAGDDRLLPAEPADAGRYVRDGRIVAAGVGGRAEQPGDRNRLNRRRSVRRQAGTSVRWEPLWRCAWTEGSTCTL